MQTARYVSMVFHTQNSAHFALTPTFPGPAIHPVSQREPMFTSRTETVPALGMPGQTTDDQKRASTPNDALRAGADWIKWR